MIRKLTALLLVLSFLVGCSSKAENNKTINLGYLPITHALSVFETKEILDQTNVHIKLTKFSNWADLMDALNAGRIDGASVLVELAMKAKSNGIDLKAVALGHKDGNVIIAKKDIKKMSDLKGKTIAIPHAQSSHNILIQLALEKAHLTKNDVKIIQLAPSEMPSSLNSGAIDAYCVAEPFGAVAINTKIGHVLKTSEELWQNSICCAMVFNNASITKKQTQINQVISAYKQAGKKLAKRKEAMRIASKYLGQDKAVLKQSLAWIHFDDLTLTQEDYDNLALKVKQDGINPNPPSYQDFIYQGATAHD